MPRRYGGGYLVHGIAQGQGRGVRFQLKDPAICGFRKFTDQTCYGFDAVRVRGTVADDDETIVPEACAALP